MSDTTTTYLVTGMTCGHCVRAVSAEVSALPGVCDVQVELATGAVTVTSGAPLVRAEIAAAVTEAGYELTNNELTDNELTDNSGGSTA